MSNSESSLDKWSRFSSIVAVFAAIIAGVSVVLAENKDFQLNLPVFSESQKYSNVDIIVLNQQGLPIKNAQISFISAGEISTKNTDVNGYVKLEISRNTFADILIAKPGFTTVRRTVNVGNESLNLIIPLAAR